MKSPRFTLRALLIFLALAALPAWGYTLWRRSVAFAEMAEKYDLKLVTDSYNSFAHYWLYEAPPTASERARFTYLRRVLDYDEQMYWKYRRAALYPWLPVGPDPPPPVRPPVIPLPRPPAERT
jgi:hypothetical protein